MQTVNGFWDMVQQYIGGNVGYIFVALAGVLLLYHVKKEQQIASFISVFLLLATVFNPWSYQFIIKFTNAGWTKTYYRFFWIIPCESAAAYILYQCLHSIKNLKQRMLFVCGICIGILCICTTWESWKLPENSYQVPQEILEVAYAFDNLKESTNQKQITILADQNICHSIRQYDADICFPSTIYNQNLVTGDIPELLTMLETNQNNIDPLVTKTTLKDNRIDYLVIHIKNDVSVAYMQKLHWQIVYTTSAYHILQYQEPVFQTNPLSDAGLEIESVEISIPGLTQEYHFLYLADLHIITENDEISPAELENVRSRQYWSSVSEDATAADYWKYMPDILDSCNADAILLGGDMIDFCSSSNVDCLKQGLDKLITPYLYVRADHDIKPFWCEYLTTEKCINMHNSIDGNAEVLCMELPELCIVGLNNNTNQLSASGLAQMKETFAKGKPILLLAHVPYNSLLDFSLQEMSKAVWQDRALVWGEGCSYQPDENTREFMDMLYATDSPVKEILCGHLHFTWDGDITEGTHEHIFSPAFEKKIGVITVKKAGQNK